MSCSGACEQGFKKDVIPILQLIDVSLRRMIKLAGLENNPASMAAIQSGYNPALGHMQRHTRLSTGFAHELFFPDLTDPTAPQYWSRLDYCETKKQKGDWMTKELTPIQHAAALELAGYSKG